MISYAQNFEDVMLWRALGHIENGFYIDIGAQDPIQDSVSRAFYERGWRGIHVEPTQHYAKLLKANRPDELVLQVAVGAKAGTMDFFEIPDTGISTGARTIAKQHQKRGFSSRTISVPCVTLASIFKSCVGKEIHWLKIDVEGMEKQVIQGWGSEKSRPWIIVIESTLPLSQIESFKAWEPLLLKKGYEFSYFDGLNRFYVSNKRSALLKAFSSGPNVYDGFQLAGTASSTFHLLLKNKIDALQDQLVKTIEAGTIERSNLEQSFVTKSSEQEHALQRQLAALRNEIAAKQKDIEFLQVDVQQSASKSAELLAAREREFSDRTAAREQSHRNELSSLTAELMRVNAQLLATKDEMASSLKKVQQELQDGTQAFANREKEISAQFLMLDQTHRDELSSLTAELMRVNAQLLATKDEMASSLKKVQQELQDGAQAFANREKEISVQFLMQEQAHRDELSSLRAEAVHSNAILVAANAGLEKALALKEAEFAAQLALLKQSHRAEIELKTHELAAVRRALCFRITDFLGKISRLEIFSLPSFSARPEISTYSSGYLPSEEQPIESQAMVTNLHDQRIDGDWAGGLDELLSLYDKKFLVGAYQALLGRQPDREGLYFYLAKLRNGESKMQIISDIRCSKEGREKRVYIAGLDLALRYFQLGKLPLIGGVMRTLFKLEGHSFVERRLRAIQNQLAICEDAVLNRVTSVEANLLKTLAEIQRQQSIFAECAKQPVSNLELPPSDGHVVDLPFSEKDELVREIKTWNVTR